MSIVRRIRSVGFFRPWTCGQETVSFHGKGPGRHTQLNRTSDPVLTGLPCSGTVNSLMRLWNAPSVSSQGKLYICLAHPRVLRVPTVLLIQTSAPIVSFARADPDPFHFTVRSSRSVSLRDAERCSPNEVITVEIGKPAASLGAGNRTSSRGERGAGVRNQAATGASFITWVLCRLQVQPPGNSIPGPTQHQEV